MAQSQEKLAERKRKREQQVEEEKEIEAKKMKMQEGDGEETAVENGEDAEMKNGEGDEPKEETENKEENGDSEDKPKTDEETAAKPDGDGNDSDATEEMNDEPKEEVADASIQEENSSLSTSKLSISCDFGTPILVRHKSGLPDASRFGAGVEEHIPFENLPDSTGTFEKMRSILGTIRNKFKKSDD